MPAGIREPEMAMEKQLGRKLGSVFGLILLGS